jgi:VWFA-related protein
MRVVRRAAWLAGAVALLAEAVVAVAGQGASGRSVFRSAIELTTVNATVVDADGRLVRGLPKEAFDVYEDGQLQTITQFTNERVPISLGILFDISDSMFGRRLHDARLAIEEFVGGLVEHGDEYSITAFNHHQYPLAPWTSDRQAATRVLEPLHASGSTAIYDAVVASLPQVARRHRQRAALLVLSDGADTASDTTTRGVRSALLRTDAFVYAIAIDTPGGWAINTRVNPTALREITDPSGGRTLVVESTAAAARALTEVTEELNSQYLIGYSSPKTADGGYHSIRVRVRGTDYRVRARSGYVATPKD